MQLSEAAFYVQQRDRDKAAERERWERERGLERERTDRAVEQDRLAALERAAERAERAAERELRLTMVVITAVAAVAIAFVSGNRR